MSRLRAAGARDFYPRSPRGERPTRRSTVIGRRLFLSTLPARGATRGILGGHQRGDHFYPRSPRGERPCRTASTDTPRWISIHAPREGSDSVACVGWKRESGFLSTLPARGATCGGCALEILRRKFLSTLPARGATTCPSRPAAARWYFYPRSPRGERLRISSIALTAS